MRGSKPLFSPDLEQRFQARLRRESKQAFRHACTIAIVLYPAFSIVDAITQPAHLRGLSLIRYITVAALLAIALLFRLPRLQSRTYLGGVILLSTAALGISLMCVHLGGYESPYYAGVNLVMLGGVLLLPWGAPRMGLLLAWILLLYTGPVLMQAEFRIANFPVFFNNLAFLVSTAIVGTSAAFLSDRLRRQTFAQYMAARDARDRIEQSVSILSRELRPDENPPAPDQALDSVVSLSHELAEARTQAQAALRVRDEFISIASHELKTPLTVLQLQNSVLDRLANSGSPASGSQLATEVERSRQQLNRLSRLVDEMLDLSRIESGRIHFQPEPADLRDLCRDTLEKMAAPLERAGIRVTADLPEPAPGRFDPLRIEQVILNLLGNAIKYAPHCGLNVQLRVEGGANGRVARLKFSDQGPGIPPAARERIFERYERGPADPGVSGLGLGLYISRKIVEGHGGCISVCEAEGCGACFIVEIPLEKGE